LPLDVCNHLTRIGLKPAPIKVLRHQSKLDDEIAGQVFRFDLAALFPPEPDQGPLIITHDDSGVGAPDEGAPICRIGDCFDTHFSALRSALLR
jgi:hypothetical protein